MERLLKKESIELWATHLTRPFVFDRPLGDREFAALIVVLQTDVQPAERYAISEALVAHGCRFAVCTGVACSSWHDSIDQAFVSSDPSFNPPDERFVMTTWHENEALGDVVEFFRLSTAYDSFSPTLFVALFVGGATTEYGDARVELVRAFSGRHA